VGRNQQTIAEPVELAGRGLFAGQEVCLRLCPTETSTGVLFVRTDLPDHPVVPARVDSLANGFHCTVLCWNEVEVRSVEHLLAACMGLGVDNLVVEIDGAELPGLEGNSLPYANALLSAGIVEQNVEKPSLQVHDVQSVSEGDASVVAMPAQEGLSINYVLQFDEGYADMQAVSFRLERDRFLEDIAPARTFAIEDDIEEFEKGSLGKGVTDENAVILFKDGSVRKPLSRTAARLRFADECARHKVLDLLGDLALANLDIAGRIVAFRSGHRLNTALATKLAAIVEEKGKPSEEYLDIREIQRILPHRYPFLLVDRILRMEEDKKIVGLKNVSMNEPFFQGHFPDYPIMPGIMQLEALAQVAGVLLLRKLEHTGQVALLVSMDSVKLRRPVLPGDQLILEAEVVRVRSRAAQVNARATVNGELSCEAAMRFMLVDAELL